MYLKSYLTSIEMRSTYAYVSREVKRIGVLVFSVKCMCVYVLKSDLTVYIWNTVCIFVYRKKGLVSEAYVCLCIV